MDPGHITSNTPTDDAWDLPALPGEQAALEALRWSWDLAYDIGVDDGQWWDRRRDGLGGTETAATPDLLHTRIVNDYTDLPYPARHQRAAPRNRRTPDRTPHDRRQHTTHPHRSRPRGHR